MCELGVESVETLFLALPEITGEDTFKVLKDFWKVRIEYYTLHDPVSAFIQTFPIQRTVHVYKHL